MARTRHSTPGVGLISPPPHHDIYSIEDLGPPDPRPQERQPGRADPRQPGLRGRRRHGRRGCLEGARRRRPHLGSRRRHRRLAADVAEARGWPWEIGLAETQQTLVLNNLRDRIVVQVDGQIKTGRDVVVAALLGAEEFGFATAPLVVSGCIMMRVCHLDTRPGHRDAEPRFRARFSGKPGVRADLLRVRRRGGAREHLAALGFRSIEEAIGQASALDTSRAVNHWKASGLDLSPIFADVQSPDGAPRRNTTGQDHGLEKALDHSAHRDRPRGHHRRRPGHRRGRGPQRQPHDRHPARPRGHQGPPGRAARRHDRPDPGGCGRAVAGRVPPARRHAAAARRGERLRGQGPVRRPRGGPPRPRRAAGRGQCHRRQRHRLWRHVGRDLPARSGRRALLRPQLGRHGGRRGRRRPRL